MDASDHRPARRARTSSRSEGCPLHPLIVHATIVLTPLTVLALLLGTFWPAARRRLGIVTPLAATAVLVLVPVTVAAGQSLAAGDRAGARRRATIADSARCCCRGRSALFVVAVAQWAWYRYGDARVRRDSPTARADRRDRARRGIRRRRPRHGRDCSCSSATREPAPSGAGSSAEAGRESYANASTGGQAHTRLRSP